MSNAKTTLPADVGIEAEFGEFVPFLKRGTQVPCERDRLFATTANDQKVADVAVLAGGSVRASDNTLLCRAELDGLVPARCGIVRVRVGLQVDGDMGLLLRLEEVATGRRTEVRCGIGEDGKDFPEADPEDDLAFRELVRKQYIVSRAVANIREITAGTTEQQWSPAFRKTMELVGSWNPDTCDDAALDAAIETINNSQFETALLAMVAKTGSGPD